jgi:hypothetical protein
VLLALALLAPAAIAQPRAWDQKEVTAIAVELADALRDLKHTVRRNPKQRVGSSQRRAQYRARESLRFLVGLSSRLAAQLRAGDDLDATLPTFRRLQMVRRDAERDARRAFLPEPTVERIAGAQALIDRLAAFYGSEPDATESDSEAPDS